MLRLAGRPLVMRLAPRAPAALRGAARPSPPPPRRSLCATASGTDTRYRIPPRTVPDSAILTVDDEAVGETRDFSLSSRLVQARALYRFFCFTATQPPPTAAPHRAPAHAIHASRCKPPAVPCVATRAVPLG